MIITEQKPMEEVQEMIAPYEKLFIVGCGTCSTSCQTGGEDEVKEMTEKLGDRVVGWAMVEDPCDLRLDRRDLKAYKEQIADSDAILVMACGAGVQTVGTYSKKI
ncbi:5,10-methylenetetrahydrofolate reductase, partial [Candidatus Bathyarchaeota archaeon]|nr:5,10-methylenetetrahydrofolate reductase [Candidatus Bathyarchaeota archaeon]